MLVFDLSNPLELPFTVSCVMRSSPNWSDCGSSRLKIDEIVLCETTTPLEPIPIMWKLGAAWSIASSFRRFLRVSNRWSGSLPSLILSSRGRSLAIECMKLVPVSRWRPKRWSRWPLRLKIRMCQRKSEFHTKTKEQDKNILSWWKCVP